MEQLKKALEKLNISVDDKMLDSFRMYMDGILEWNEKVNLTAIRDRNEFVAKHYIDSILCCDFQEYKNAEKIIDVGTGGGFPGVPLAIVNPEKIFLLADSLNKRLKIVSSLAEEIGIDNISTIHGRAEELGRNKKLREGFDLCISRAVANMAVLAEYCLPFVKVGGFVLAYKGPEAEKEILAAEKAIKILGGRVDRIEETDLSGFVHNIVVIEKIKNTPAKYPRKAGTPTKEPIL